MRDLKANDVGRESVVLSSNRCWVAADDSLPLGYGLLEPSSRHTRRMDGEQHSRLVDGRRQHFSTARLWRLVEGLPVTEVPIDSIVEFDQDCWFHGQAPTCRQVAEHARRIAAADLAHPVILSAGGGLMDGGHRIAKAWLTGATIVRAVRFAVDPEPDYVDP